jgi:hypothetical protein
MPQSPGRNSKLENAWRAISRFVFRSANVTTGQTSPLAGQLGLFSSETMVGRRYDQEYIETPVRDAPRAWHLINLRHRSEVSTAIDILVGDVFSSEDGDDLGFSIGATLNDGVTPVDPKILAIGLPLINRLTRGDVLTTVVEEFLIYGDSFRSLIVDRECRSILRLKQLPTWEMFRVEDKDGNIDRFEQRRYLSGSGDSVFEISPAVCIHWRYRRRFKYGRSLFEEAIPDSDALEQGYFAVDKAAMAIGFNPNIHVMPKGWNPKQCADYQRAYENERDRNGRVMTDFFMTEGGDVRKLAGTWNPDLSALIDNVQQRRMRIAMRSRIPPWMIGLPTQGARDIAGQPALAYARFIGSIRSILAEGLRQIIDLELALNGFTKDQMEYRLIFPKIYTNTQAQSGTGGEPEEMDSPGIEDLDTLFRKTRDRYSTSDLEN